MSSREYAAAIVGLGRIAWRFDAGGGSGPARTHLASYRKNSRTRVICGCSPVLGDRREFEAFSGGLAYESLEQALKQRPDIVSICSPSEAHYEQVLACMDYSVPMIWLEKPPTLGLSELDRLIQHAAYRDGRTKVVVNYMRRFSATYARLRELHLQQGLGRTAGLQVLYSRGLETNGSHFLDFVSWLMGDRPPSQVLVCQEDRHRPSPTFQLRYEGGCTVAFCGHDVSYHINDIILACEGGRASVLSGGMETRVELRQENELYAGFYRLRAAESDLLEVSRDDDPFSTALVDLIEAKETGRETRSNLRTARNAQAVIEEIRRG